MPDHRGPALDDYQGASGGWRAGAEAARRGGDGRGDGDLLTHSFGNLETVCGLILREPFLPADSSIS